MWVRFHRFLSVLCLMVLVSGCVRPAQTPPDWGIRPEVDQVRTPAGQRMAWRDVYGLGDRSSWFIDPAGDPEDAIVVRLVEAEDGQSWRALVGDRYESVFRINEEGDLVTGVEIDREENARVSYEPAIPVLPAEMVVGEVIEGEVRMVIRDLRRGTVRQQGPCRYELELLGRRAVATPAGTWEAWIVRTRRTADFGVAGFVLDQHEAYVEGVGRIAGHSVRRIRVLGAWLAPQTEELLLKRKAEQ